MMKKRNGILIGVIVNISAVHLAFIVDPAAGAITAGRARALVGAAVGLISVVIGGFSLARCAGRMGAGDGRVWALMALALGLIGMALSAAHLSRFTGGFGTGSGRAGAIVALALGLIGLILGGSALASCRRSRGAV